MIINTEYIRNYRQIARNISEERVEIFIGEAQMFDLLPVVGDTLMQKFEAVTSSEYDAATEETCEELGLTLQEYRYVQGGTWTDCNGVTHRQAGLRAACAYFAYARFIRNHATQTTPYGVVVKEGDDSTPATAQQVAAVSRDAQVIGEQILRDAAAYWKAVNTDDTLLTRPRQRHFVAIGD